MSKLAHLISVAKGKLPADLVLANAKVVNVFTGEVESGNVAICEGRVAGVGDYYQAKKVLDLSGKYLAPGLINGHTHIESSMLDIDAVVRKAIRSGLDPVRAIQMTTINAAEYFRLDRLGAIAPGYIANLIVIGDLSSLQIDMVFSVLVRRYSQPHKQVKLGDDKNG